MLKKKIINFFSPQIRSKICRTVVVIDNTDICSSRHFQLVLLLLLDDVILLFHYVTFVVLYSWYNDEDFCTTKQKRFPCRRQQALQLFV